MARLSPTFPPSASSASAMAAPHQRHAHVIEGGGDWSMRLVNTDPHRADTRKGGEDCVSDPAGSGLDQTVALCAKRFAHAIDCLVVGHGIQDLVRTSGGRKIDFQVKVKDEGLPDLGLVRHDAVIGVQGQAANKNPVSHWAASIAAPTRSACTVSATSWARTIAAPFWIASRWAAIEPPIRSSGPDGVTLLMKRLREAPTRSGKPKRVNSVSRARQVMLCSAVLPKP